MLALGDSIQPNHYAAIDLGSNSFHMIVVEMTQDSLRVLDKHKEMVRLASGLSDDDLLSPEIEQAALDCLERFSQRLSSVPKENIRVVGTNTLRRASNTSGFLTRAKRILGHHIDIISGYEEARLIYLGVSHALEDNNQRRLVIDIGGGSTEFITGKHFTPDQLNSLEMGCVNTTQRFFPGGEINSAFLNLAISQCEAKLRPYVMKMRTAGWDIAVGSSGTVKAIASVLKANGFGDFITQEGLVWLQDKLLTFSNMESLEIEGLTEERWKTFPGGFAVLKAAFNLLEIGQMEASSGALREGLVYDMQGRTNKENIRQKTVNHWLKTCQQDAHYAALIMDAIDKLYQQASIYLDLNESQLDLRRLIAWAGQLHEVGRIISYKKLHQHGAYILQHAELPGFSVAEQELLEIWVRNQRKKINKDDLARIDSQPMREKAIWLLCLLRIAVILLRDRRAHPLPFIMIEKRKLSLLFDEGWLDRHSLTRLDLEQEAEYLERLDIKLAFR